MVQEAGQNAARPYFTQRMSIRYTYFPQSNTRILRFIIFTEGYHMSFRNRRFAAGVGIICLGIVLTAGSLVAQRDTHWADLQVDPEWTEFRTFITDRDMGIDNEHWQAFEQAYPGKWLTQWDTRNGVPHVILGPGIDTGKTNMTEFEANNIAYDMIAEHGELFRLGGFDFEPETSFAGRLWHVDMYLVHDAVPFEEHTRFALRINNENGKIAAIKAYDIPISVEDSVPTTTPQNAIDRVMASLHDRLNTELTPSEPVLNYLVDPYGNARLVWRFEVRNDDKTDPFGKEYFVHARTGSTVYKINELIHYDYSGSVSAQVLLLGPFDGSSSATLEDARVTITAGGSGSQFTDGAGLFNFVGGTGNRTIRSQLDGRWSNVNNQAGGDLQQSLTAGPGNNFPFNHTGTSELILAQQTAFYWVTDTHNWSSPIMGNNGLEFELPTNVNINSSCNAFWDGSSVNFYQSGGGCPNTATSDIVLHECGHGVDAGRGGILNGGLSEGFGDAMAMARTDQSCTGRGFFGPGTCLRDGNNVRLWPAGECGGSVHCLGEVYGQFTWEMTKQLKQTHGNIIGRQIADPLVLLPAVANSADIPDAVLDTFIADDDNGNINDGTPNYDDIATAALSRNLPFPEIPALTWDYPDGLPDFLTPGGTTIRVNVVANRETPIDDTGELIYRFNGGSFVTVPMQSVGLHQYEATIPSQNCFDDFDYYFRVDYVGGTSTDPFTAPASTYSGIVAQNVTIAFEDDFQTNKGWTVVNENLTDGAWQRGVPAGGGSRNDPPTDADGSGSCYVTDNVAGNSDVDGGPTRLISPTFNMSSGGQISFSYWHSNNTGEDQFQCQVSNNNGASYVTAFQQAGGNDGWQNHSFNVSDFVTPTSTMRVRFNSTDNPNDSITESGVDAFMAFSVECTDPPDPLILTLLPDPTVAGQQATAGVGNADPNTRVVIYFTKGSVDVGNGPCPPELGGLCLDIVGNSVKKVFDGNASNFGQVNRTRTVPLSLMGRTIALQAANVLGAGGVDSRLSNAFERTIQ